MTLYYKLKNMTLYSKLKTWHYITN